jgi:hypothetical protein
MEDQYISVVKRFMKLAATTAHAFPVVPTSITELVNNNDGKKLFHIDIGKGMTMRKIEPDRVIKIFQGGELTIGYNENFKLKNPIRSSLFKNYELEDCGEVSKITLATIGTHYKTGLQNALLHCYYPSNNGDINNTTVAIDEKKIRFVYGQTFPKSGRLESKRELTQEDPKKLHQLINNLEPLVDHIIKTRLKPSEIELPRLYLAHLR